MNVAYIRNTLKFQVVGWLVPVHESVHGLPDPSFSTHVPVCLSFSIPSLALIRFPRPRCLVLVMCYTFYCHLRTVSTSKNSFY